MAKAKAKEASLEPEFVEVEHFADAKDAVYVGDGFRAHFVDGKALVPAAFVQELKEAKLIK
jgi:hypothetical protein